MRVKIALKLNKDLRSCPPPKVKPDFERIEATYW